MKLLPSLLLAGLLLPVANSCIYVRVRGDLDAVLDDGDADPDSIAFHGLREAVEGRLVDPKFQLAIRGTPWRTTARWTVAFVGAGSDEEAAFRQVQEAVRRRVEERGGHVAQESDERTSTSASEASAAGSAPHREWSCTFHVGDEPGEASVEIRDRDRDDEQRERELVLTWKAAD